MDRHITEVSYEGHTILFCDLSNLRSREIIDTLPELTAAALAKQIHLPVLDVLSQPAPVPVSNRPA